MPDIGFLPSIESDVGGRDVAVAGRAVLVSFVLAGAVLAAFATPSGQAAQAAHLAGPELTRLLRAMAGLKLLFAAVMLAAFAWRLAVPASAWRLVCYGVAGAAMAAGPVLIWDMVHIPLGALLLHGGLLAGALLFWRDPAVGARLGAMVDRRRSTFRHRG
jgi:phosphate/sulfate permease